MSSAVFVLFFVLVVAAGIGFVVLGYLAAKRRHEEMASIARQRGWSYAPRDDRWTETWQGSPFGTGHDRRADNVLQGAYDGRRFVAFDYRYSTTETSTDAQGHRQSREVHHPFSVVALDLGYGFPELSVTPEGFFGRAWGRLTNSDIELESEDFNRMFTVTCPDRKFASDVLHPQMMEYVMTAPDLGWRFASGWLLATTEGQHAIADVDAKLTRIDGIGDRIPEFVWRAAGRPPVA